MDLEESISLLPTLFAAVLLGPLAGLIVASASMLGDFRKPYLRSVVYTASRGLNGGITGLIALSVADVASSELGAIVMATLAGAVAAQLLDIGFACLTVWLRGTTRPWDTARTIAPVALSAVPLYAPVVVFLTIAYQELSPWTLVLFFVPALAAQRLFALLQQQRQLTEGLSSANRQLERANLSFASALVVTLTRAIATRLATRLPLPSTHAISQSGWGCLTLNGRACTLLASCMTSAKSVLTPGLLEKEALSLEERRIMQNHSEIGERILANVDGYGDIAHVVRHHHERIHGNGYPHGFVADEIPLLSRIIAVADAYNAMTSDRPYRKLCQAGLRACALPKPSVRNSTRALLPPSRRSWPLPTSRIAAARVMSSTSSATGARRALKFPQQQSSPSRRGRVYSRPSCAALSAASVLELTPSFSKMWRT